MDNSEMILRLALAAAAGVVIGFEREVHGHPAGMRTHTLVAVGAAVFTLAGAYGFADFTRSPNVDPARLAAQVASGIGFIGAGAILRDGMGVRGITTAATLWLGAALGVAAAAGIFTELAFATGLVLVILVALRLVKPLVQRFSVTTVVLHLAYAPGHGLLGALIRDLNGLGARVQHLRVSDEDDDEAASPGKASNDGLVRHVRVPMTVRDTDSLYELVEALEKRVAVRSVQLEVRSD